MAEADGEDVLSEDGVDCAGFAGARPADERDFEDIARGDAADCFEFFDAVENPGMDV